MALSTLETFSGAIGEETQQLGSFGIHPETVGNIDYVSYSIKNKIVEGKYINLATLLILESNY